MPTGKGKIVYQRDVTDFTTGEIKSSEKDIYVEKEPDYIKLYLADIVALSDVPKWVTSVLNELLKLTNYNNEIVLNGYVKKSIAEKLGVVAKTIDNALLSSVKGKILFRKGSGVYIANPYLFGKGEWRSVRKLRLQVDYSPAGRILRADVDKEIAPSKQIDLEDILRELAVDQAA